MIAIGIAVIIGVFIAVTYVMGLIVGLQFRPTDTGGNNNNEAECDELCKQWQDRRVELCKANSFVLWLKDKIVTTTRQMRQAFTAAGVLAVASALASLIPLVGPLISIGLAVAAASALTFANMLLGELNGLSVRLSEAEIIADQKSALETAARNLISLHCSKEKADECLSTASPC